MFINFCTGWFRINNTHFLGNAPVNNESSICRVEHYSYLCKLRNFNGNTWKSSDKFLFFWRHFEILLHSNELISPKWTEVRNWSMLISFVDTQSEVGNIFPMSGKFERMRWKIYVCPEMRIVPLTGETHLPLSRIFSDIWEAI